MNGDGVINFFDVDPFVALLTGGQAALARTLTWNAETRLIDVRPATAEAYLPTNGSAIRVAFGYDYMGRRIEKIVYTWQSGSPNAWVETARTRFVYDGWLLLEELDVDSGGDVQGVRRQYTWGLDLAGLSGAAGSIGAAAAISQGMGGTGVPPVSFGRTDLQSVSGLHAAGGIGGLLAMYDTLGTTTGENPTADDKAYYYCCDGNGNAVQVLDASDGAIAVKYEYDAYGNRVPPRASSSTNPSGSAPNTSTFTRRCTTMGIDTICRELEGGGAGIRSMNSVAYTYTCMLETLPYTCMMRSDCLEITAMDAARVPAARTRRTRLVRSTSTPSTVQQARTRHAPVVDVIVLVGEVDGSGVFCRYSGARAARATCEYEGTQEYSPIQSWS